MSSVAASCWGGGNKNCSPSHSHSNKKKIVRGFVRCIFQNLLYEKKKIDMIFLVGLKVRHSLRCNGVSYVVVGDHLVTSDSYLECLTFRHRDSSV